jgi:hypothetical protein
LVELTEDRVRELAYQLWEQNGSPEGRDEEFWQAAQKLLAEQEQPMPEDPAAAMPMAAIVGRTLK